MLGSAGSFGGFCFVYPGGRVPVTVLPSGEMLKLPDSVGRRHRRPSPARRSRSAARRPMTLLAACDWRERSYCSNRGQRQRDTTSDASQSALLPGSELKPESIAQRTPRPVEERVQWVSDDPFKIKSVKAALPRSSHVRDGGIPAAGREVCSFRLDEGSRCGYGYSGRDGTRQAVMTGSKADP